MKLVLPAPVTLETFDKALARFESVVGKAWVLATDEDRETYLDAYALGDGTDHAPSAAVAPQSVEEVQAIVRIANELKIPLWPIALGRCALGGASARHELLEGSVRRSKDFPGTLVSWMVGIT